MSCHRVEENGPDSLTEDDVAEQFRQSVNSPKPLSVAAYISKVNPNKNAEFQQMYDELKSRK